MIINGTTYSDKTLPEVANALERARLNHTRVRLFLGDQDTGRDWHEENDLIGYIKRSTGPRPSPILVYDERSTGGPAILTDSIVWIMDTHGRTLWKHPQYHGKTFTLRVPSEGPGYAADVLENGETCANFHKITSAENYIKFMTGQQATKRGGLV